MDEKNKFPNVFDVNEMMLMYKKNLELIEIINKMSVELCQGITKLQMTLVSEMLKEFGKTDDSSSGKNMTKFVEASKENMQKIMENSKTVADMISSSYGQTGQKVMDHFKESWENLYKKHKQ